MDRHFKDERFFVAPKLRGVGGPVEELASGIDEVGDYIFWKWDEVGVFDVLLRSDDPPQALFRLLSLRGVRDSLQLLIPSLVSQALLAEDPVPACRLLGEFDFVNMSLVSLFVTGYAAGSTFPRERTEVSYERVAFVQEYLGLPWAAEDWERRASAFLLPPPNPLPEAWAYTLVEAKIAGAEQLGPVIDAVNADVAGSVDALRSVNPVDSFPLLSVVSDEVLIGCLPHLLDRWSVATMFRVGGIVGHLPHSVQRIEVPKALTERPRQFHDFEQEEILGDRRLPWPMHS